MFGAESRFLFLEELPDCYTKLSRENRTFRMRFLCVVGYANTKAFTRSAMFRVSTENRHNEIQGPEDPKHEKSGALGCLSIAA